MTFSTFTSPERPDPVNSHRELADDQEVLKFMTSVQTKRMIYGTLLSLFIYTKNEENISFFTIDTVETN